MGNPTEFDRELLSAYLDDALEGPERARAEEVLATHPGAVRYLDQLRSTRECLKSVPRSQLRSSLAARVLEQARAQALAEGLPGDHHVLRASPDAPSATSDAPYVVPSGGDGSSKRSRRVSHRIAWAVMAVAAAVIAGLAVLPLVPLNQPQNAVAQHEPGEKVSGEVASGQPASANDEERSPFDSVAANDGSAPEAVGKLPPGREPAETPSEVAHVSSDRRRQAPALDFIMIIDAVVSTDAWESDRFEALLEKFGIPVASPIVADQDLIKVLEETRVVVGSAAEVSSGQQPRAALIYLRADATTLDRLYQAMHQDRQSFPEVVTDVSIDPNSALHTVLRRQSSTEDQRGPAAQVLSAGAAANTTQEVAPQFIPAQRKMVSSDRSAVPSLGTMPSLNPSAPSAMSEAIVILRQPSKSAD